ncbi:hypothetical protein [Pleomorphomonas sp. PLEO]|uniref:hypothetical protein n=1 Tax=Pleomorphomonas sp. PLEO TaxID=3239306 RepID=UPI00351E95CB
MDFGTITGYTYPTPHAPPALGYDMREFAAAAMFLCLAILPAAASWDHPDPSSQFPGWLFQMNDDDGTFRYTCAAPRICGEGSIVSYRLHAAPAPTEAEIRSAQKEPRLPITCRRIGNKESCEYPNAIDSNGRPTHWRPASNQGSKADMFHSGYLYKRLPDGGHFLFTISSSALTDKQARKNYDMIRSSLTDASH